MDKPFQRIGSKSNAQVGVDFEILAQEYFKKQGASLIRGHAVHIGISTKVKLHAFDLGCETHKVLVECKSHRWTAGHNIPSAKLTVWNEAMYYFLAAPQEYRKILFVLLDLRNGTGESLAKYYVRTNNHLIPPGVEIWECDEVSRQAHRVDAEPFAQPLCTIPTDIAPTGKTCSIFL